MSLLNLLLFITTALASGTTYYIDQQPLKSQYNALQPCAQNLVKDVVKDMKSGCGISGSQYTSFDCFCTSSKIEMEMMLRSDILSSCSTGPDAAGPASQQATSALNLYDNYCALPQILNSQAAATPTPAPSTMATSVSASPGGAIAAAGATITSFASPTAVTGSSGLSTGAIVGIAVGVAVFCVLLLILAIILFLLHRRHQRRASPTRQDQNEKRRDDSESMQATIVLDQRSPVSERSDSCNSLKRAVTRSDNPPSSTSSLINNREEADATSPTDLISPVTPATHAVFWGDRQQSHARNNTARSCVTPAQPPAQLPEKRMTPLAELPDDAEVKEMEGVSVVDREREWTKRVLNGGEGGGCKGE